MIDVIKCHDKAVPYERIVSFCLKWNIIEFSLFGSILRDDFRPDSDVDVLVVFAPHIHWRIAQQVEMKEELGGVFGHEVDLVEKRLVEKSPNYLRRNDILNNRKLLYAA